MDTSLAIPRYDRPALAWPDRVVEQRQHILWWVVFVGFAFAVAIAYAAYCTHMGDTPAHLVTKRSIARPHRPRSTIIHVRPGDANFRLSRSAAAVIGPLCHLRPRTTGDGSSSAGASE